MWRSPGFISFVLPASYHWKEATLNLFQEFILSKCKKNVQEVWQDGYYRTPSNALDESAFQEKLPSMVYFWKQWVKLCKKYSSLGFLVWFIFPRRLGWHSSCPFPLQNYEGQHLIATLPFGTQTFNLFTLNAPSFASVPLSLWSNPIQEAL